MKILSSHYTAFSRQITEAVRINRNKGPHLLNSKSEYNRNSLPCIRTSNKKLKWELSEIYENEIKDLIRILKYNRVKINNKMRLEDEVGVDSQEIKISEFPNRKMKMKLSMKMQTMMKKKIKIKMRMKTKN